MFIPEVEYRLCLRAHMQELATFVGGTISATQLFEHSENDILNLI